jgi:hypothetical protein
VIIPDVYNWFYNAARWTWHDPDGYNFISGPLADITLLGGGYAIARHHNCHVKGCWRVGRQQVPGTSYIVCRKHHPHSAPSAQKILDAHDDAIRRRDANDANLAAAAPSVAAPTGAGAAPTDTAAAPDGSPPGQPSAG